MQTGCKQNANKERAQTLVKPMQNETFHGPRGVCRQLKASRKRDANRLQTGCKQFTNSLQTVYKQLQTVYKQFTFKEMAQTLVKPM